MKIRTRFNLAILGVFVVGLAATAIPLRQVQEDEARDEVLQDARIMIAAAEAIRDYTDREIFPLTGIDRNGKFVAQAIPFYAAVKNFQAVHKQYPDYTYREATLNPTNPIDRATDWEADIIRSFRDHPDQKEFIGERETATGRSLTLAEPIRVDAEDCLTCHSQPSRAPQAMLAVYGSANGFGWQMNEAVGARVVSVPMAVPLAKAWQGFVTYMVILTAVFAVMTAVLNLLLHFVVTKPVVKIAGIAERVSLGNENVEEFEVKGNDEIASLSQSFNRMRRSLESAMKMLGS
jgi:protein-histidine pros-kinase